MHYKSTTIPSGTIEVVAYGNVVLFRAQCPTCRLASYVDQGITRCCRAIVAVEHVRQTRASEAHKDRRQITQVQRVAKIAEQAGLCFYCLRVLFSEVYRHGKAVWLRPEADHFLPYSYLQTHDAKTLVMACHVCNSIKRNLVFLTVDAAREYLAMRWRRKGYSDELPELG